jgi:protein TonB
VTDATAPGNDRLMMAVLIAGAVHVLIIFGINFDAIRRELESRQVEVTLVQTPGRRPQDAEHIAQADQQGSGSEALRDLSAGAPVALPQARAGVAPRDLAAPRGREQLAAPAVTSVDAARRVNDRRGEATRIDDLPPAERELARLNEKLERLQADLAAQRQRRSQTPRVRRLDAVSAKAAVDAAYLAEWRRRVEGVGNQYYPEASLRYGIYGSLRMLVTVRSDGQLDDIEILSPSGHAVLDEAAIRIVRMAAPYPPFPDELAATTDKLEIVRTWQFEQNPLSSR